jgi:ATP-dependent helicase/nuclease subunit B
MSGKEYLELLEAGMSAAKVGVIPPGTDYILIGDIERTRLEHIKVLFFLGVNDGVIPKGAQSGGILSEIERETLTGSDMELAPGMRERAFIQRFYLYMNLTKPMKRLYVTYGRMDMDGKAVRRSFLIPTLLRLFPRLTVTEYEESDLYAQPSQTLESMRTTLIDHTRQLAAARGDATKDYLKLLSLYREREDGFVQKVMQAAYYEYRKEVLSSEEALKLYGEVLANSVTRLEQYAQCAFAHFAAYGLKLTPRRIPSFEPVDMGSVLHLALERYSDLLRENGLTYLTVSEEQRQELIDEAIDYAVKRPGVEILFDNARNEYQIQRIRRIFERTVWAVTKQLEAGKFVPYATEVSFRIVKEPKSVEVHAAKHGKMILNGRIDRLDLVEKEDKVLVKIVDYKSSGRDFDWAQFYYGLSLQLPLYLEAACEKLKKDYPDKEIVPAGILYYGMNDPLISLDLDAQQQQIDEELLKQLKPKGLLNSEDEVLVLFDTPKEGSSLVAPIGYNKNGSLKKGSSVADSDAFQQILHHTDRSIRRIAGEMYEGNVSVEPYELSGKEACTYCDYKSVCGFDPMLKGCDWRILEPLGEEEVLMRMKKEAQEEAEDKETGKESMKEQE